MDKLDWSPIWRNDPALCRPLAVSQVRLCLASLDDVQIETWPQRVLDERESSRAEAIRDVRQRQRFVASRVLLREQLAQSVGVGPDALQFQILAHGKPVLQGISGLHFNLAHTGSHWMLGLSATDILGVDLERIRPLSNMLRLAERVFSVAERQELAAIKDQAAQQAAFFRGWTRKEAALKALGTGFSESARAIHIGLDAHSEAYCECTDGQRLYIRSGVTPSGLLWAIATRNPVSELQSFKICFDELADA